MISLTGNTFCFFSGSLRPINAANRARTGQVARHKWMQKLANVEQHFGDEVFSLLTVMTRSVRSPLEVFHMLGVPAPNPWLCMNGFHMFPLRQMTKPDWYNLYISVYLYDQKRPDECINIWTYLNAQDSELATTDRTVIRSQDKITSALTWAKVASPELGYWQVPKSGLDWFSPISTRKEDGKGNKIRTKGAMCWCCFRCRCRWPASELGIGQPQARHSTHVTHVQRVQRRPEPSLSTSLSLHRTLDYCNDGQCRAVVDTGGGSGQETTSYFSHLIYLFSLFYGFPFASNQMVGTVLLLAKPGTSLLAVPEDFAEQLQQDRVWCCSGPCHSSKSSSRQHSSASFSAFLYSRVFLGNTPLKHSVPTCLHNTSSQTLQRIFSSTFRYKASDTTLLPPTLLSLTLRNNTSPQHSFAALSPISPKLHCNISCPFNTFSPRFR